MTTLCKTPILKGEVHVLRGDQLPKYKIRWIPDADIPRYFRNLQPSLPSSQEICSVVATLVDSGAERCSASDAFEGLECVGGKWVAKPGYEDTI